MVGKEGGWGGKGRGGWEQWLRVAVANGCFVSMAPPKQTWVKVAPVRIASLISDRCR